MNPQKEGGLNLNGRGVPILEDNQFKAHILNLVTAQQKAT